ncbi:hypothetical protein [Roseateles paludis]|uniref:Uncharacterized protein n=1 Tax=Roseateles paludis TaxID=3145238 RepID=A0ABV0G0I5_9BURK
MLVVLVLLVGLLLYRATRGVAEASALPPGAATMKHARSAPIRLAQAAGPLPAGQPPGLPASQPDSALEGRPLSARAQRMRADWCGYGAAEHERETDAFLAKHEQITAERLAEMAQLDGARVLQQAASAVQRRWIQQLSARRDERSRAVAEWLESVYGDDAAARSRLQALARTSTDPMVTALAVLRPCELGRCANVDRAQWSRLEPQNLYAWLAALPTKEARADELRYVHGRWMAEARYAHSYVQEFTDILEKLLGPANGGLTEEVELGVLSGGAGTLMLPSFLGITRPCSTSGSYVLPASACTAAAELLWREGDVLERSIAMRLSERASQGDALLRERWAVRQTALDAAKQFQSESLDALSKQFDRLRATSHCAVLPMWREAILSNRPGREWDSLQAGIKTRDANQDELARRWRARQAVDRPASATKPP